MTTLVWSAIAIVTAVALFWGINNKNNNVKNNGCNSNFILND